MPPGRGPRVSSPESPLRRRWLNSGMREGGRKKEREGGIGRRKEKESKRGEMRRGRRKGGREENIEEMEGEKR